MASTVEPGTKLGNYQLLLELASGGMATVYAARHLGAAGFERLVVVKRVHPHLLTNREFYDMFRDEARVAALIRHPNVVAVTDVVEDDCELFLVMEYCESHALSTLVKAVRNAGANPLSVGIVVRIFADMLAGLQAAHEATDMLGQPLNVVHRDVSPQNIIVGTDGSTRLIDFGVAKAARRLTETKSGSLKGKLSYMSPEQASGTPVDRRADIFSTGCALHEALTGTRLFKGESEAETLARLLSAPIPAPSTVEPSVPEKIDRVVLKALARDPAKRFQTAAEFLVALEKAAPAATAREVAELVDHFCGERTRARRVELQEMVDSLSRPTQPMQEHVEAKKPRSKLPFIVAGGILVGGFLPLGIWQLVREGAATSAGPDASHVAPARLDAAPAIPPDASLAAADAPAPVVLTLNASSPIASVRAPGLESARIASTQAQINVRPWEGELRIEATLESGKTVRALASASGPRTLRLDGPAAPDAGGVVRRRPSPAPVPPPDLHDNPYGER